MRVMVLIKATEQSEAGEMPSQELLESGYIFVCGDARGRYESEGVFQEMNPHIDDKKSCEKGKTCDVDERRIRMTRSSFC